MPKYEIEVQLSGTDGNAFSLIAKCTRKARRSGISREEIKKFSKEATSGDYQNVLSVCREWFIIN